MIGIFALSKFSQLFNDPDSLDIALTVRARRQNSDVTTHEFDRFTVDNNFLLQRYDVSDDGRQV